MEGRPEMEEVVEVLKRTSALLGSYEEPFAHLHRNSGEVTRTSPPLGGPPAVRKPSSRALPRKPSVRDAFQEKSGGGGGEAAPYDVDAPPPMQALQRPSKVREEESPAHEVREVVGGAIVNETPPGPPRNTRGTFPPFAHFVDPKPIG